MWQTRFTGYRWAVDYWGLTYDLRSCCDGYWKQPFLMYAGLTLLVVGTGFFKPTHDFDYF